MSRWRISFRRVDELMRSALRSPLFRLIALLLGILGVILIWISTVWLIPKLDSLLQIVIAPQQAESVARYGAVGDMFGAINSLFSGLALGAIALTLWLEARSRREARKPLVVGGIDSTDTTVARPRIEGGEVIVPLRIPVRLSNQTADAALNVSCKLRLLLGAKTDWKIGLDGPLLRDAGQDVVFCIDLHERDWRPVLAELTSQRSVEMELATIYRSLEGLNWMTVVTYTFSVRTTDQHYALLDAVRNGTWDQEGIWQNDALVSISTRIKQGSWDHRLY